jgi:hypothetical protein
LISGKTILWNDFIAAGITQLKDICYEVKTGFLPDNAIVEMVTNVNCFDVHILKSTNLLFMFTLMSITIFSVLVYILVCIV